MKVVLTINIKCYLAKKGIKTIQGLLCTRKYSGKSKCWQEIFKRVSDSFVTLCAVSTVLVCGKQQTS
jgi:hypothetical protein